MAMQKHLLAKLWTQLSIPPREATFLGHHQQTLRAADVILEITADDQLCALGLEKSIFKERFIRVVRTGAALHDLGKANDHFQGCVTATRKIPQAIRHEWICYWLLHQQSHLVCEFKEDDWYVLLWTVTGHHRKEYPEKPRSGDGNSTVDVCIHHPDFIEYVQWIKSEVGARIAFDRDLESVPTTQIIEMIREYRKKDERLWRSKRGLELNCLRRFTAAAKACLIAADVAASALPNVFSGDGRSAEIESWIRSALNVRPAEDDLLSLIRDRLEGLPFRKFQEKVAHTRGNVVLLTAGCATGKTIAAYARAAKQWKGLRVFFCYPTTGTASEGFHGYLVDNENGKVKSNAKLFHSRAEVDLEKMLVTDNYEDEGEQPVRCESLAAWSTPISCCTVDTVLGLLQNQRRGIYAWPALARSAFVFDEIHAYDDKLFGLLLRFLENLPGCPVLLMTASLPVHRLESIKTAVERRGDEELIELSGHVELENLPRYSRMINENINLEEIVRAELVDGGRVLWISNTVTRSMDAAKRFSDLHHLYCHSRYRYIDRVERHADIMKAFGRNSTGPALAFCTQVAEMSLDISATLLVTDLAPIPSLIQRLGRLNRFAIDATAKACSFITITPQNDRGDFYSAPYSFSEYGDWPPVTKSWLDSLGSGPFSQADLVEAWQQVTGDDDSPVPESSVWLDGGPSSKPDSTRKDSYSISVLLESDAKRVKNRECKAVELVIPMPAPYHIKQWNEWKRINGILVATNETINYCKHGGATWQNE